MRTASRSVSLFALALIAHGAPAICQESVRDLEGTGARTKFLSRDQVDRWRFRATGGSWVQARVSTGGFDPELVLVRNDGAEGEDGPFTTLAEVDDDGGTSSLLFRIGSDARYELRVQAVDRRGGGNYQLDVDRFDAFDMQPGTLGTPIQARTDQSGRAHVTFTIEDEPIVSAEIRGLPGARIAFLDGQGTEIATLADVARMPGTGRFVARVVGRPDQPFAIALYPADRRRLPTAGSGPSELRIEPRRVDVFTFEAERGELCWMRLTGDPEPWSNLEFRGTEDPESLDGSEGPAFREIHVTNKGGRRDFLVFVGRDGPFELRALNVTGRTIEGAIEVPALPDPMAPGEERDGDLPIGGVHIESFDAEVGDLLVVRARSNDFDPKVRVLGPDGQELFGDDDSGAGLNAFARHLTRRPGRHYLLTESAGGGGGGAFEVGVEVETPIELPVGTESSGTLQGRAMTVFAVEGPVGERSILRVRAPESEASVQVLSPSGRLLARQSGAGETQTLVPLEIEEPGRHIVVLSGVRSGPFSIRRIAD